MIFPLFVPLMLTALTPRASAAEPYNHELTLHAQAVFASKRDHPWGVRLGVADLLAIGDHCSRYETDCRSGAGLAGSLWPLVGPSAGLEWRGGKRFAADLSADAGLGSVDMDQLGFIPYWQIMARPGLRWTWEDGAVLLLGAQLSKSLSGRFYTPDAQSYALHSTEPLSLRVDVGSGLKLSGGVAAPTVTMGLQSITQAGGYD